MKYFTNTLTAIHVLITLPVKTLKTNTKILYWKTKVTGGRFFVMAKELERL